MNGSGTSYPVTLRSIVTALSANRDRADATGADHCTRHADDPTPGPCGNCKDQREANKARPALYAVAAVTQRCLVHYEPDVTHCRGCAADAKASESA